MNIHATAIALGACGVLIEGPSGSGKTSLALAAIEKLQNRFAALVADDQSLIEAANGRLIATCAPALAGLAEMRGFGIVKIPVIQSVVVDMVIRLIDQTKIERLPESKTITLEGIELPFFELPARQIAVALPVLIEIVKNRRV